MSTILIRQGHIIPTSRAEDDLPTGDILITDGVITAIGPSLAGAAEKADEIIDATGKIVIPGLIDTHRHVWESATRSALPDGSLMDYFNTILFGHGRHFTPDDVHASNLLGAVGAVDSGVTTLLDWSHVSTTPEHADAAITALQAAGLRAVYAHSVPVHPLQEWLTVESVHRHPEDLRRIQKQYFSSGDQLVTLAAGVRGPEFSSYEAAEDDIRFARELGLRITMHAGCSALGARNTVEHLHDKGLLGDDITYIHLNTASDGALKLIADSGGTVSSSPAIEAVMGHGFPVFARLQAVGLAPSLSIDAECSVAGDLFGQMRAAYQQSRMCSFQLEMAGQEDVPFHTTRDALAWGTIEGARALGLDSVTGSLEVGKQGDIVILDLNTLDAAPVNDAVGAVVLNGLPQHVTDVLVAGNIVKRDRWLVCADAQKIVNDGIAARDRVIARAAG
ncbi:MAG TPA: amidohydrolase family protein [Amycolatopsis sp.]|nr:amidohydrolase family protein [Amycolatopsis sp.]